MEIPFQTGNVSSPTLVHETRQLNFFTAYVCMRQAIFKVFVQSAVHQFQVRCPTETGACVWHTNFEWHSYADASHSIAYPKLKM